jgi:pyruvate/2-oxoglutarate dehydrogenase complex dihydrolipoamide acyltransferase (E2) component
MAVQLVFQDLGEGVVEGEIVRWYVQPGDRVEADQPLLEVMTDKVTTDLPSPAGGVVVETHGQVGEIIPVGHVLVVVETAPSTPPPPVEPAPPPAAVPPPAAPADLPGSAAPLAVPAVRRLARELEVDLAAVRGSGPGGRILESDVRAAAERIDEVSPPAPEDSAEPEGPGVERAPLRGLRRAIAEHLLDSHRTTAPYTLVEEVDFTELVGLRERIRPLAQKTGTRITYLPFLIAALGMALREHPRLNARVDAATGDLLVYRDQHVAIAVHTDEGLVVPVIRDVQQRNLMDLAREVERLTTAARAQRLSREDLAGGTISLTSLGAVGGVMGTPMLNTPQVAVVGVHRITQRPVIREGNVVARQMANLSLTLDHRYIDGYEGAQFAESVKKLLEDPAVLLFSLTELRS